MATLISRYADFVKNIDRARELVGLGQSLTGLTVGTVDPTDMYRAALVQSVAALDSYAHDVVLDRAVDILLGRLAAGSATRLGLHFGAVRELLAAPTPTDLEMICRQKINERLSTETFQKPDDVAGAFAMVGVPAIWSSAFGTSAGTTKTSLSLVVQRRNRIVHRCDVDPSDPSSFLALTAEDAIQAIETVRSIVSGINGLL